LADVVFMDAETPQVLLRLARMLLVFAKWSPLTRVSRAAVSRAHRGEKAHTLRPL
jgi:hypothetical protein